MQISKLLKIDRFPSPGLLHPHGYGLVGIPGTDQAHTCQYPMQRNTIDLMTPKKSKGSTEV